MDQWQLATPPAASLISDGAWMGQPHQHAQFSWCTVASCTKGGGDWVPRGIRVIKSVCDHPSAPVRPALLSMCPLDPIDHWGGRRSCQQRGPPTSEKACGKASLGQAPCFLGMSSVPMRQSAQGLLRLLCRNLLCAASIQGRAQGEALGRRGGAPRRWPPGRVVRPGLTERAIAQAG